MGGRKGNAFSGDVLGIASIEVIDLTTMTSIHQATSIDSTLEKTLVITLCYAVMCDCECHVNA
jgi:hypothetical protein